MDHARRSFTATVPLDEAEVVVLGVPFDGTAIARPLQRYGPTVIRWALRHVNDHVPRRGRSMPEAVHDAGDVEVAPDLETTLERARETVAELGDRAAGAFPALLGGEHSVSLAAVRELEPGTIVSFDAHTDLWPEYEDVAYNHATWLYHAQEELDCDVVLLGARAWPRELEATIDEVDPMTSLSGGLDEPVYVTVDVDVFDPAYAPEVGFPEPEGLNPHTVFDRLATVFRQNDVCGFDVVEVATDELGSATANLAAQTLVRALASLD